MSSSTSHTPAVQTDNPLKRRRSSVSVTAGAGPCRKRHHALSRKQEMPPHTEPAPQDSVFVQSQLLRSIAAALSLAGFDSTKASALEEFRALAEEYMLHFLHDVQVAMHSGHRATAIASDFVYALSSIQRQSTTWGNVGGLTSSDFEHHLTLSALPDAISAPKVDPPRATAEPPPPDFSSMLGPELQDITEQHAYIPSHFPPLPSKHAYKCSPVFTARENDARKIREKATDEGIKAEQALRKLTGAASRGVQKTRRKERDRDRERETRREELWERTVGDVVKKEEEDVTISFGFDGAADEAKVADILKTGAGLRVNHDRGHWRRGGGGPRVVR